LATEKLTRIGCVDDDEVIREIAQFSLAGLGGYEVAVFTSGEDAVKNIGAFAPDLILLDMYLGGMNGMETLAHLRAIPALAKVPVVIMTGASQSKDFPLYISKGAAGVIVKPFNPMTFPEIVSRMWEEKC
jgi:two-component system, OmpR family, response regulator